MHAPSVDQNEDQNQADWPVNSLTVPGRWSSSTVRRGERRVWEVKTRRSEKVTRSNVNQLLGQIEVEMTRAAKTRVLGCLLTPGKRGPAPGRLVGCRRERGRVGEVAAIAPGGHGHGVAAGWFVHVWHGTSGL